MQWEKYSHFNKWFWKNYLHKQLDLFLTPYTNFNSKWTTDLKVRTETSSEKTKKQKNFLTLVLAMILWMTPKTQATKQKIHKKNKLKNCTTKESINGVKRQNKKLEKKFASNTSAKWLVTKIYRELLWLNNFKKCFKNVERTW